MAMVVAGLAAPAFAGGLEPPRGATPSWCERHADAWGGTGVRRDLGFFFGLGTNTDREVLSAYACYDARLPTGGRRSELISAWWDPENGSAGASCVRQAPGALLSCKRTALSLPAEGTTPLTHDGEPWWLHLLAVDFAYGVAPQGIEVTWQAWEQCLFESCVRSDGHRAVVRPDAKFRAAGQECRVQGESSCARSGTGTTVAYGEGGAPSASVDDGVVVTAPALCVDVEASSDVDLRC